MEEMTEARLADLDAQYAATSQGPWDARECRLYWDEGAYSRYCVEVPFSGYLASDPNYEPIPEADLDWIATAHNAYPALSTALRAAWAERDRLLQALEQANTNGDLLLQALAGRDADVVALEYAGRAQPLPVDNPWTEEPPP